MPGSASPWPEYLGRSGSDVIYDLEVTPNRPYLNSVICIAREIAAVTGNALKIPALNVPAGGSADATAALPTDELVSVRIEDAEFCPRYTARIVKGVKVGPSPDWLKSALENAGIRSISNVVDVTNFVMMETGQPLHAKSLIPAIISSRGARTANRPSWSAARRRAKNSRRWTTMNAR